MDINSVEAWLKGSLLGIVILGAIGSLLAALLLKTLSIFLRPTLKKYAPKYIASIMMHFVKPAVRAYVKLHFETGKYKKDIFFSIYVMKFCAALAFTSWALAFFGIAVLLSPAALLRLPVILPVVAAFLGVWYSIRIAAVFMVPRFISLDDKIDEAVKAAQER